MAKLLTLLLEVTSLFDMRTRSEVPMLRRTMVVVEDVACTLDPRLDICATAEPIVQEGITRHLGPAGSSKALPGGVGDVSHVLVRIPGLLQQVLRAREQIDLATCKGLSLTSQIAA